MRVRPAAWVSRFDVSRLSIKPNQGADQVSG